MKTEMAVNIPVQIFCLGITDRFVQFYQRSILCGHIDHNIRRNSLRLVSQPFDRTCVDQRSHANRFFLIIDLRIQIADLKLRNHIYHTSHFPVSKNHCTVLVKQRNLTEIHRLDIFRKVAFLDGQQISILFCIYDGGR